MNYFWFCQIIGICMLSRTGTLAMPKDVMVMVVRLSLVSARFRVHKTL
jgi:hypothetical protein